MACSVHFFRPTFGPRQAEGSMTVDYKLTIRTDARLGAGTDSTIAVVLVGTRAESGPHTLDKRFHNDFQARQRMYPWRPAEATAELPGALEISQERPLPKDELYRGLTEGSYEVVIAKTLASIKLHLPVLSKAWNGLVDIFDFFKGIEMPK